MKAGHPFAKKYRKRFFIMMYYQSGKGAHPINEDDDVVFFKSRKAALECAENNPFCRMCGYEIFAMRIVC